MEQCSRDTTAPSIGRSGEQDFLRRQLQAVSHLGYFRRADAESGEICRCGRRVAHMLDRIIRMYADQRRLRICPVQPVRRKGRRAETTWARQCRCHWGMCQGMTGGVTKPPTCPPACGGHKTVSCVRNSHAYVTPCTQLTCSKHDLMHGPALHL